MTAPRTAPHGRTAHPRPAPRAAGPRAWSVRLGIRRGVTEFGHMLRTPEDVGWNVLIGVALLVYLWTQKDTPVPGADGLTVPALALAGILAATIMFGMTLGPAFALATEVEDGTVLRLRAAPRGTSTYTVGMLTAQVLGTLPMLAVLLVPWPFLLGDPMHQGPGGWVALVGWLLLGTLAMLPVGVVVGALCGRPARVLPFGVAPVVILAFVSGVFGPPTGLPGWAQGTVQAFPLYWLAHGMRSTTLPEAAEALEIGGAWHPGIAAAVLAAWAVAGVVVAPLVLRRVTSRQTAGAMAARLQAHLQRTA
ncbi:ABC transporter permease [Cellulomonas shaoxiangyii]|uniref:ABC transporter permease n=1 Tax=Cellulomonas shaoxiangyii TaxID=2566013 RepID=A0A4P7SFN1_9CELL|nr:ABC transporter permease [Cellulomonas shaoxiangyii]QCB92368.1 ABC transporter permease [Cellulomonas shaoxiangyii]TGY86238.1 ABC transporter permease [Cellulomonas shaoxiangyii]